MLFNIYADRKNVRFLKTNSGKKGEGMPVVRNQMFYFKEGFCWSAVNTIFLKCRLKLKSINDVQSMALYPFENGIPAYYFVCLINSSFVSHYVNDFLNNTSIFQINDARKIPIIIPSKDELERAYYIYQTGISLMKVIQSSHLSMEYQNNKLLELQNCLDDFVLKLYASH